MACLWGWDSFAPQPPRSTRVTWGVFDGVHLGHRAVLEEAAAWARAAGAGAIVLTFDPHPQAFLRKICIPLVLPVAERARRIGQCGIDTVLVVPFDRHFSERSAESFVFDVLLGALGAGGLVIGYDSTFGRGGQGTVDTLRRLAGQRGVEVRCPAPRLLAGTAVKSSLLRDAIVRGDLAAAAAMMGRPVQLAGSVVRGDGRGRTLGIPTANMECRGIVLPPAGVYAVRGEIVGRESDASPADGVMNIGRRPTFGGDGSAGVEVHFFEPPDRDLYGQALRVEVVARLRDERTFADAGALRSQIAADCERAREALAGG